MSNLSPNAHTLNTSLKPQRVLACVLCQKRKIKCDRKYPCANCVRSQTQCIPSTQVPRRRRRRFPERELLERLRKYEDLLRKNNINFEPLHKDLTEANETINMTGGYSSDEENPRTTAADWSSPAMSANSERAYKAKYVPEKISNMWLTAIGIYCRL